MTTCATVGLAWIGYVYFGSYKPPPNISVILLLLCIPTFAVVSALIVNTYMMRLNEGLVLQLTLIDKRRILSGASAAAAYRMRFIIACVMGLSWYFLFRVFRQIPYAAISYSRSLIIWEQWYAPELFRMALMTSMAFWLFVTFIGWMSFSFYIGAAFGLKSSFHFGLLVTTCVIAIAVGIAGPMMVRDFLMGLLDVPDRTWVRLDDITRFPMWAVIAMIPYTFMVIIKRSV